MNDTSTLAARIAEARELSGLTTAQAAKRLSITTKTLKAWETGQSVPRPNRLQTLSGVMGVSLLWLLNGDSSHDPLPTRMNRLQQLQVKMNSLNALQAKVQRLSKEIADEVEMLRKIDEELEDLVA